MSSQIASTIRIPTGISGLDPLIEGGLHVGDMALVIGDIGTGKTLFSCEFACNVLKKSDERSVIVSFDEDKASLIRNMSQFGLDLAELEAQKRIKILDLEALEGRGMGANIETILGALDQIKATRLVVDSLTAFMSGATEKFDYSFLMHLVYKTLKREGITTMLTLDKPQASGRSRIGIEEFVVDGLFQLESYVTRQNEMKTRLMIRKLRGTDHSRKYHSVIFSSEGLKILPFST